MKSLKCLSVLLLIIFTVFSSCKKDEIEESNNSNKQTDNLEPIGILGLWKLESRSVNGITDMSIQCCDYIEFNADNELHDLKGLFQASGNGYETNGVFELETANDTIQLVYDNTQKSYGFEISNDLMIFTYSEDSQSITENWRKE